MNSDYSFYNMKKGDKFTEPRYNPKIVFEKSPLKPQSTHPTNIWKDAEVKRPQNKFNPKDAIKFYDVEKQWATSNYNTNDHFDYTRLNTLDKYSKFYHGDQFVRYDVPLPLFVPSNKIHINSPRGVEEQWRLFSSHTGISRKQEEKQLERVARSGGVTGVTSEKIKFEGGEEAEYGEFMAGTEEHFTSEEYANADIDDLTAEKAVVAEALKAHKAKLHRLRATMKQAEWKEAFKALNEQFKTDLKASLATHRTQTTAKRETDRVAAEAAATAKAEAEAKAKANAEAEAEKERQRQEEVVKTQKDIAGEQEYMTEQIKIAEAEIKATGSKEHKDLRAVLIEYNAALGNIKPLTQAKFTEVQKKFTKRIAEATEKVDKKAEEATEIGRVDTMIEELIAEWKRALETETNDRAKIELTAGISYLENNVKSKHISEQMKAILEEKARVIKELKRAKGDDAGSATEGEAEASESEEEEEEEEEDPHAGGQSAPRPEEMPDVIKDFIVKTSNAKLKRLAKTSIDYVKLVKDLTDNSINIRKTKTRLGYRLQFYKLKAGQTSATAKEGKADMNYDEVLAFIYKTQPAVAPKK